VGWEVVCVRERGSWKGGSGILVKRKKRGLIPTNPGHEKGQDGLVCRLNDLVEEVFPSTTMPP